MALQASREFQAEVRREIAAMRARLEKLEKLEVLVSELLGDEQPTEHVAPPTDNGNGGKSAIARIVSGEMDHPVSPSAHPTWADMVAAVLKESGKPLGVLEIMDGIRERGYRIDKPRNIFYNSVYTTLKRNNRFVSAGDSTWSLSYK